MSGTDAVLKKICLLGSFAVGKTSLVRRYVESIFDERYLTTVGVKMDRKRVEADERSVELVIWDLAGDDGVSKPRQGYFRGANGYLLVVDGCRAMTVERAIELQEEAAAVSGPMPVVVALNKADLKSEWELKRTDLDRFAEKNWPCIETSAKNGKGVEQLFVELAGNMLTQSE